MVMIEREREIELATLGYCLQRGRGQLTKADPFLFSILTVSLLAGGNGLDIPFIKGRSQVFFLSCVAYCIFCPASEVQSVARTGEALDWLILGGARTASLLVSLSRRYDFLHTTTFASPVCRNERQLEPR